MPDHINIYCYKHSSKKQNVITKSESKLIQDTSETEFAFEVEYMLSAICSIDPTGLLHGKPEGRNYKPLYFSTRGVVAGSRQALQAAGSPTLRAAPRTVQLARAARYHRPRGSNIQSLLGNGNLYV